MKKGEGQMSKKSLFDTMITGKKVLFIPIYSMRDYKTGIYNLEADGNMARIYSKLRTAKPEKAVVAIPQYVLKAPEDFFEGFVTTEGNEAIKWIKTDAYGTNAKETRNEVTKFLKFLDNFDLNEFDYIVVEPNLLALYLTANEDIESKLVYWCVASVTSEMCPWFVRDYIDIDKMIASKITTIVSLPNQQQALGGKSIIDPNFYDAKIFDYPIVYFPFRISDMSYHFDCVVKAVHSLWGKGLVNFKVLYTDVNNSLDENLIPEEIKHLFKKVPADKEIYLSILKSKPIIPYLENPNNMVHISIFEFAYYQCDVIMRKSNNITFNSATIIDHIDYLENALRDKLLEKGARYL